ncbi:MAG: M4 family metallopeptidase, partial [Planctomycetota bacterium]
MAGARGQSVDGPLQVRRSRVTGLATWVTAIDGETIPVAVPPGRTRPRPVDFLNEYGHLFGIAAPQNQLTEAGTQADSLGFAHTTYRQLHQGVPVFSGVLKVHQNSQGEIVASNGDFYPISPALDVIPTVTANEAVAAAYAVMAGGSPEVEERTLVIVDPGWYGDPPAGEHLAYYLILTDMSVPLREAFFIDAHSGAILDQWTVLHTARFREVYDGQGDSELPGVLVRAEGDPPVAAPEDANRAYDYAGDVYDYFDRAFGRDGIDDSGMTMILTVDTAWNCPNAFWNGEQMAFCADTVGDDVVAHEVTHGITQHTAGLIYQNQPGQLNESFSDVFGELVDLFNGDAAFVGPPSNPPQWPAHATGPGTDAPNTTRTACSPAPDYGDGMRWLMSEDALAFGGAIRDMWDPTCGGDPDRAFSLLQKCLPWDNGGVHSGSGVPNHAFAMLVDGKTFNGYTVDPIGPIKAGAVWYRALTVYLTAVSDFEEAFHCFNQAAQDLIGTYPNDPRTGDPGAEMFTTDDAEQTETALRAVEMNGPGRCG